MSKLSPWFCKCGPRTSSSSSLWNLVRNANSPPFSVGPSNVGLNQLSRASWCLVKFENHWRKQMPCSSIWVHRGKRQLGPPVRGTGGEQSHVFEGSRGAALL